MSNEQIAQKAALRLCPESDPGFEYHVEVILDAIKQAARRCTLPDSIQEALNSGDGTYKP